jgi:hypothetical protein
MDVSILIGILIILIAFLAVSQLGMLYRINRKENQVLDEKKELQEKITSLVATTEDKSQAIVHEAIQKANDLMVAAELEGIQAVSSGKLSGREALEEFKSHLVAVEKAFNEQFNKGAQNAEESYKKFILDVEDIMQKNMMANQKLLEDRSAKMATDSQQLLEKFVTDVQTYVKGEVQRELDGARKDIAEYKQRRISVIDERIVDMLEEVLKVALEKKLSLVEQSELVYKALDEAKKENAFI